MPRDTLDEISDDALLALYAQGDPRVAPILTARHLPRVYRHAVRALGDPALAEDVAQEAMLRLWQIAPKWRAGEAQVSTWLYRVTANLATDLLRKKRMVGLDQASDTPDPAPPAEEAMQRSARLDALQNALEMLPDRQREAVVLRHIEGLANPEIGAIMGLGVRAVESLVARGKRALSARLMGRRAELGFEDET